MYCVYCVYCVLCVCALLCFDNDFFCVVMHGHPTAVAGMAAFDYALTNLTINSLNYSSAIATFNGLGSVQM